jgi:hypothetical protein
MAAQHAYADTHPYISSYISHLHTVSPRQCFLSYSKSITAIFTLQMQLQRYLQLPSALLTVLSGSLSTSGNERTTIASNQDIGQQDLVILGKKRLE